MMAHKPMISPEPTLQVWIHPNRFPAMLLLHHLKRPCLMTAGPPKLDALTDIEPLAPLLLPKDPVRVITNPIFLPSGFPETRDLSRDVQAGEIPVRGQSHFSKVDILSSSPLVYHDASPLPPPSLLASLSPASQVLVYGDGHPCDGFLRSFYIADLPSMEWNKLAGLTVFVMLPSFSLFDDEPPFYSHKTIVKQPISLPRFSKKNGRTTHIWLAYISRSNIADSSFATLLDRRIDLIPTLSFPYLSVVCPILHLALRDANTNLIAENTSPLDHPLIIMHLRSSPLSKKHVVRTVEFSPRVAPNEAVSDSIYHAQATLFLLCIDVPSKVVLDYEGSEVTFNITGTLPLMLMLNGLSPDDTSTVLRDILAPRITKEFRPIPVNSCPDGFKRFDFHVPIDVLSRFYQEQHALADMQVSSGLLHESVKDNALVITHQPRFQKGGPKRKKMPSPEIRDAIEMYSSLQKTFAFVILLNKYDVFAMVREKVPIKPAVQEKENLGEMIVVCATTQQRLTAKDVTRTVAPPYTLIWLPPTYAVTEILRSAATFGPVQSQQLFQQSGILLMKYQAVSSARASYRATLPGPVPFTSGSPDNDTLESLDQRLRTVALSDHQQLMRSTWL